jgi:CRP-like cAMP-binding protein
MMMPKQTSLSQNRLLAALPPKDFSSISAQLELVPMPLGMMLYEPNEHLRFAYFPTTCIVSLLNTTDSGASAETAGVGNEGMVGISLFMGGNTTPSSAVVSTAGIAYRLDRIILKQEFSRAGYFQNILLRYTQALMTQMAQMAVCNRHHSVEEQLCRWLLLTLDRQATNELVITQELIASLLGVRRESISEAAGDLQRAGFISYRRGHISVLNRVGLENKTCECYEEVKTEIDRLLSDVKNHQAAEPNHVQAPRPSLLRRDD